MTDPTESLPADSPENEGDPGITTAGPVGSEPTNMEEDGRTPDAETSSAGPWVTPTQADVESAAAPSSQDETAIDQAQRQAGRASAGSTFTRVSVGSALIALDTLTDRLEQVESAEEQAQQTRRTREAVLIPISEWDEEFGEPPSREARYLMLGVAADARNRVSKGGKVLSWASDAMANTLNLFLKPLRTSSVFSPLRRRFDASVERGETQVKHWKDMGRAEDTHSRTVAQYALNQFADETMDEITENERIQVFIQDMVAAQSLGIIDEAIEEVRERTLSSDYFIERPVRRLLRRPPRDEIPPPNYSQEIRRSAKWRQFPPAEDSLLGHYAGFTSRLLSFAIDSALMIIFLALGSWIFSTMIQVLGLEGLFESLFGEGSVAETAKILFSGANGTLIIIAYLLVSWILTGQTVGMMIMGLRVIAADGDRLTFWQAVRRLIGMFIAAFAFYLGYLWILGDDRRRGWQDIIGGTYIVYAWDARPDESFLADYQLRRY